MAKGLWHIDNKTSIIKNIDVPSENEDIIQIESKYSLISSGTERLVALGKCEGIPSNEISVPYMEGDFSLPIKYGYSLVGKIMNENTLKGKNVHIMHPHQDICWVDKKDITILPDGLNLKKASLISNIETVINAIWDSKISIGDTILIAGFGNIGSLLAETIKHIPGIKIHITDNNSWKINKIKRLGFNLLKRENNFDIAFDTTSTSEGLQTCIEKTKQEGKIINLSWYGNKKININLGSDFHYGRKKIISSQVSNIPNTKKLEL